MFGDDILAAPVCKPADKVTGLAERSMWFPEGTDWYDVSTGIMYKGGSEHILLYTIEECPYFVKAGSVIPMAGSQIMTLQKQSTDLKLFVVPGLGESRTEVYEDDGTTQSYEKEYAVTEIVKMTTDNQVTLKVAPRKGTFDGMLDSRRISVVLDGFFAPSSVSVNGTDVPYSRFASYDGTDGRQVWGYEGHNLQTTVWLSEMPSDQALEIVFLFDGKASSELLSGKKGLINRVANMTPEAKLCFAALKIQDFQIPAPFTTIAQCGSYITEDPANAAKYLEAMDSKAMIDNINSWERLSPDFKAKVTAQVQFETQPEEIKVISYNIRYITPKDGPNEWKYRAEASPAMILDNAPDIFGVQEAYAEQLRYLDDNLPNYSFVGVGREDGLSKGEHMAIYYNTDKVELLDWGTYWLSETPEVPSKGWDAACKRTATWTLLKMKESGRRFYYVNTHLDHRGVEAQRKGLDLIVSRIEEMNIDCLPMILTGDFNIQPDNPALTELNVRMLNAKNTAIKTDTLGTYNGWGTRSLVIDYIYYYRFSKCPEYETITSPYKGVTHISDHYPIAARLIF